MPSPRKIVVAESGEWSRRRAVISSVLAICSLIAAIGVAAVETSLTIGVVTSSTIRTAIIAATALLYLVIVIVIGLSTILLIPLSQRLQRRVGIFGCFFVMVADVLTLYTLTWMKVHHLTSANDDIGSIINVGIAFICAALPAQLTFFSYIMLRKSQLETGKTDLELVQIKIETPKRSPQQQRQKSKSPPHAVELPAESLEKVPTYQPTGIPTPTISVPKPFSRQELRQESSETKLLARSASCGDNNGRHTRSSSHCTSYENDGFDDWDYKACSIEELERTHRLDRSLIHFDYISNNRSVSPAKYFHNLYHAEDSFNHNVPQPGILMTCLRHSSAASLRSNISSHRDSYSNISQSRRPSTSQSNIHPLFRAESVGPLPLPSPGTVIMASPFAGQIISPDAIGFSSVRRLRSTPTIRPRVQSPIDPGVYAPFGSPQLKT